MINQTHPQHTLWKKVRWVVNKVTDNLKTGLIIVLCATTLDSCSPSLPELKEEFITTYIDLEKKLKTQDYKNTQYKNLQAVNKEWESSGTKGKNAENNKKQLREYEKSLSKELQESNSDLVKLQKMGEKYLEKGGILDDLKTGVKKRKEETKQNQREEEEYTNFDDSVKTIRDALEGTIQ